MPIMAALPYSYGACKLHRAFPVAVPRCWHYSDGASIRASVRIALPPLHRHGWKRVFKWSAGWQQTRDDDQLIDGDDT